LHIHNQLKRSEDLEISEMDYLDNENLQQICDLKQPILFEYRPVNPEFIESVTLDRLFDAPSLDLKVKECKDESGDYIFLPYKSANSLFISDTKSRYYSDCNDDFIEEAGLSGFFEDNNVFLKPPFVVNTKYDCIVGSKSAVLPLRYHTRSRSFLCVNSGKISVKMTPWKSRKYLFPNKDFENYDFRSPVNPWNPQDEFSDSMAKLRFLEFDVQAGYVLYIPPYWWYSIKLSDSTDNLITKFDYDTAISFLTNMPNYAMYYLQQSNISKIMKKPAEEEKNDS
jgi:hypothetical protein